MLAEERSSDEQASTTRFAGEPAHGQFLCCGCGYGIAVRAVLPTCPMCAGDEWEEPFLRALVPPLH